MVLKPVILDPFQTIRSVGWNVGNKIVVIQLEYSKNGTSIPAFNLFDLPFTGSYDPFAVEVINSVDGPVPEIKETITKEMQKELRMWNYPPHDIPVEGGRAKKAMIFLNVSRILQKLPIDQRAEISFKISTPPGGTVTIGGTTTYWVWFDFGDPFPGVPPIDHEANVSFDSVWGTRAEAQARADLLNEHSAYSVHEETTGATTGPDDFTWTLRVSSYKKKKAFPATDDLVPEWPPSDAIMVKTETPVESPAVAKTVLVRLNPLTMILATTQS